MQVHPENTVSLKKGEPLVVTTRSFLRDSVICVAGGRVQSVGCLAFGERQRRTSSLDLYCGAVYCLLILRCECVWRVKKNWSLDLSVCCVVKQVVDFGFVLQELSQGLKCVGG